MKKLLLIGTILLAACSSNSSEEKGEFTPEQPITFVTATNNNTRAYRQENGNISETVWESGDQIAIWGANASGTTTFADRICTSKNTGLYTTFEPSEATSIDYKFYAMYPYPGPVVGSLNSTYPKIKYAIPVQQTISLVNGKLTNSAKTVQVGVSTQTYSAATNVTEVELNFRNICSTLELGLKSNDEITLSSLEISVIDNGGFAGYLTEELPMDLEKSYNNKIPTDLFGDKITDSPFVTISGNFISITFSDGLKLSGTEQKIQIPVGHFKLGTTDGLEIKFTDNNNKVYTKTIWTSRSVDLTSEPQHVYQPLAALKSSDFSNIESFWKNGEAYKAYTHTEGTGIEIFVVADGYTKEQHKKISVVGETSESIVEQKMRAAVTNGIFDIEPYKTYKNRFDVYFIFAYSTDEGVSTSSTNKNTAYSVKIPSTNQDFTVSKPNCRQIIEKAIGHSISGKSVLVLANSSSIGGTTRHEYSYVANGKTGNVENIRQYVLIKGEESLFADKYNIMTSYSICPTNAYSYPHKVKHEFCGHAYGHLGDEYWYDNNATPTSINVDELSMNHKMYVYPNVDTENSPTTVFWKEFYSYPDYASAVGIYEGAFLFGKGVYRSAEGIMRHSSNTEVKDFNAVGRRYIYQRIMEDSGETYTFAKFRAYDAKNL